MTDPSQPETRERLLGDFDEPTREEWREAAEKLLKGASFEAKLLTPTDEGLTLRPLYDASDTAGLDHAATVPGVPPYLRGTRTGGHARRPWSIAQELPSPTPAAFNEAARSDLERGQTALTVVLDRATRRGLDPDRAASGEVGAGGLSLATVDDVAGALAGIDPEVPVSVQAGPTALPVLALLVAHHGRRGHDPAALRGGMDADPLGSLARHGALDAPLDDLHDAMAATMRWGADRAPHLHLAAAHGSTWADAGASAVEELAFVLATAVEYLRELEARGVAVDEAAPRLRLSFSVGAHCFMEVAKLRAARSLWARAVEAFGGNADSQRAIVHARTGSWNKTAYDPWVNLIRTTTEAFAAVVGGVDSLHVGFFDQAIRPPDELSRRLARNVQVILQEEAHLTRVVDPAGGSWYVEALTDQVAREAWSLFQEVEGRGGMAAALRDGFPQERISATAAERRRKLATRHDVLVGINRYADVEEGLPGERDRKEGPAGDGGFAEPAHAARSRTVAAHRDGRDEAGADQVAGRLTVLAGAADADPTRAEMVEAAAEAALAGATLGELTGALPRDGEADTVTPLEPSRAAEPFEALRRAVDARVADGHRRPRAFLANLGPVPEHRARADFATGFMEVGGFQVEDSPGFDGPRAAARAALESEAPVVVVCGTDDAYRRAAASLARAVREERPDAVLVVAGRPGETAAALRAAGVDDFLHLRADILDFHARLQERLGIAG